MQGKWLIATAAGVTVVIVAAVMLLSSSTAQARSNALTAAHLGESLAVLGVIDDLVEHRPGTGSDWVPGGDGAVLDEGDGVRTDEAGFAEVLYADGSVTRLDALTEFGVVRLDGSSLAPQVTVRLDVGTTFNRVRDVTGQRGSFEVQTPVGIAAVRGTVFIITCDRRPVCTFTVLEGVVEVTTLDGQVFLVNAGEEITLGIDGRDEGGPGFAGGGTAQASGGFAGGGSDGGSTGDGGPSGDGGSTGDGGATGSGFVGTLGPGESVVATSTTAPGLEALQARPFIAANLALDEAAGMVDTGSDDCAVTVGGRNVELAGTPATAIEVPVDEDLSVSAVATGPLEDYRVDLTLADVTFLAAEGTVAPNAAGDTTSFRGVADVSDYARWGAGLYEVRARTTGTRCDVTAFVNVTGAPPLLTAPTLAAILLLAGGIAGLLSAVTSVTSPTVVAPTSIRGIVS